MWGNLDPSLVTAALFLVSGAVAWAIVAVVDRLVR